MARRREQPLDVFVYGAGKVGTALARTLRTSGAKVVLRAARTGPPRKIDATVVILAVRDRDLRTTAEAMVGIVSPKAVVLHVAGSLGTEPLEPLRGACAGVGQMHPMISFASPGFVPSLARGNVHVQGDAPAVARARQLARRLGMTPRTVRGLDTVAYHAAAGLVANGAAALAAVGADLLVRAGVPETESTKMLGPLLRSVADNVEALGLPAALTGPVRRGDAAGIQKHFQTLAEKLPTALPLYLAASEAQLPLARAIGDADPASFEAVARAIDAAKATLSPTRA
jgi:predicted short-subunit dehydrogenase-like oxidoreductase (DUF2520 family)